MLSHDTKQPMKLKGFLSYIEAHRQGKTTFSWLVALHIKDFLWYIIYRAAFLVVGLVILLVIITVWLVDSRVPLTLAVCVLWLLITIPIARNRVLIEQNQRRLRDGNFQAQLTPLLYTRLTITKPLPMMGNSAILPNFAWRLADLIEKRKPTFILEIGSGVSTLITGYALKKNNHGTSIALDHLEKFATATKETIVQHHLESVVSVIHAPLVPTQIDGKSWLWYDLSRAAIDRPIDLLIVDGPSRQTQQLARYPALPTVIDHLSEQAVVILDDGLRYDEKTIAELWLKRYPQLSLVERSRGGKGIIILQRNL